MHEIITDTSVLKVRKKELTTIISEGSRTMHSHPRRRLPADRFPKLQSRETFEKSIHLKPAEDTAIWVWTWIICKYQVISLLIFNRPVAKSTERAHKCLCELIGSSLSSVEYAVWNMCMWSDTERHWHGQLNLSFKEGKHPPLEKSTFVTSQFVQYASALIRGGY